MLKNGVWVFGLDRVQCWVVVSTNETIKVNKFKISLVLNEAPRCANVWRVVV
jgi:hypothetical protein